MSNKWTVKTLGELCNIFNGNSIPAKIKTEKYLFDQEGLPYIGTKDVSFDNEITYDTGVIIPPSDYDNFRLAPAECTFICAEGGSAGRKIGFTNQQVFFGNKLYAIVPHSELNSKFVYYYCQSDYFKEQFFSHMSGMIGGVNQKKFKTITIPLPPLETQQRIVSYLEEVFGKINNSAEQSKQKIHNANELFRSGLQRCFSNNIVSELDHEGAVRLKNDLSSAKKILLENGLLKKKKDNLNYPITKKPFDIPDNWTWAYLADISIIQEGPGIRKFQYASEGVQFLTVTNILEGAVDLEKSQKYISLEEYNQKYQHFTINKGDIVTACSGGSWGKSAIFESEELLILNTSTLRLRFFNDLGVNKYLYYLTKTDYFKRRLSSHSTGQQPNYGYSHYSIIPIPLPPINEQVAISELIDSLFENTQLLKRNYELELTNYENLKQSILQEAFSGKQTGGIAA